MKSIVLVLAALMSSLAMAAQPVAAAPHAKVEPLATETLPEYRGKEVETIVVEYPPGAVDPVHRHNAHAFVYVVEGSIVMGLNGDKEITLHAGDTFHEGPDDVHTVGRNASNTKPAKFVVFLIKNQGTPILTPVK
ncbi:cupin domain-containing protein [Burkholderia catarinensis]|uniref:cupin domain-containing protein n=1 Tax=Burkholderia catarinensis TaxID=1108140 RepID=UPI00091E5EAF|nr:cupin domain-containing protein [Burkholderia catarinensis]KAG8154984.1 cupin [Burkholderia catarinensis]